MFYMRTTGTRATGIRLPIITKGDNLVKIVTESLLAAQNEGAVKLSDGDVVGITEAIVAKADGNYCTLDDIAADIKSKFPGGTVGLVYPILSRNRFLNILKGIARGAKKVIVLLSYPSDEVGNPIADEEIVFEKADLLPKSLLTKKEFRDFFGEYRHKFTNIDYADLYTNACDNIEVWFSNDPRDILTLTDTVLCADIHTRDKTKRRLLKAGAKTVYTLEDIMAAPINGSGYNADYGVIGSNLSNDETLKLFPKNCNEFVERVQQELKAVFGKHIEVMVYGDGAFKDPVCGIWELADPVVSPGYTKGLAGQPNEIKIKYLADSNFKELDSEAKKTAITEMIREKGKNTDAMYSEGTTPRQYTDLLGSLCDLMSGSGDKGTPVILIQGYFDNYATE